VRIVAGLAIASRFVSDKATIGKFEENGRKMLVSGSRSGRKGIYFSGTR